MSKTDVRVFIAFPLTPSGGQLLTLNDAVKGYLDNASYVLGASDTYYEVTNYLLSVSTNRGKSNEMDKFQTGTASIVLDNRSRLFDPLYTSGSLYGEITPRKQIYITVNNIRVFTGWIDDWNFNYNLGGVSTAEITASDALGILSAQTLSAWTASQQQTGERIGAVLDRPEVNWATLKRNIATGSITVASQSIASNTNVLSYIQDVETCEQGYFYADNNGNLVFRKRNDLTVYDSQATFSDTPSGALIGFNFISVVYGTERLLNNVSVQRIGGTAKTASNTTSISDFGTASQSLTGLPLLTDIDAQTLAT